MPIFSGPQYTIETGIDGRTQECSYMNGTLQRIGPWDVTVHTYIEGKADMSIWTQEGLAQILRELIRGWINTADDLGLIASFEVEIGEADGC